MAETFYYEIEKVLTGTLPNYVYVLPVVGKQDNVIVRLGSGAIPNPDLDVTGKLIEIMGKYLRIRIKFQTNDTLRKIVIFKTSELEKTKFDFYLPMVAETRLVVGPTKGSDELAMTVTPVLTII